MHRTLFRDDLSVRYSFEAAALEKLDAERVLAHLARCLLYASLEIHHPGRCADEIAPTLPVLLSDEEEVAPVLVARLKRRVTLASQILDVQLLARAECEQALVLSFEERTSNPESTDREHGHGERDCERLEALHLIADRILQTIDLVEVHRILRAKVRDESALLADRLRRALAEPPQTVFAIVGLLVRVLGQTVHHLGPTFLGLTLARSTLL